MQKTIQIGEKSVKLSNNIGWTLAYRDQFNKDIVPVVLPLVAGLVDIVSGIVQEKSGGKVDMIDVISVLRDEDTATATLTHLYGLEFADFINIVWAMAACADDDIEEPKRWVRQFDSFPLDTIMPSVIELIVEGLVSSKNLERLRTAMRSLQPSNSTPLSSQA